jgi:nitrate reductase molybdenum cofactor assembly chaperone NarJ/NarW
MVDLIETYRAGGFDLVGPELPDHLPVILEYLSTRPVDEARAMLADAGHILVALAERLKRRDSSYAPVLSALVAVADAQAGTEEAAALIAEADDDQQDLEALDAVWEEAQVTFGPDPNAGCPISRDILARMDISPAPARAGT